MSTSASVATLLQQLVTLPDICLVLGPSDAICELFVDPAAMDFRVDGSFVTMENGPWHIHLDATKVHKITFVITPDTAHNSTQLSYSVRLFEAQGGAVAANRADLLDSFQWNFVRCREMTEAGNVTVDATLDATGLLCPLPVLKARRALKPLAPGAVLEVLATDPGATKDFEHFCATTGCELIEASEQPGGVLRFVMRKPG